mmetsp:Transcript_861/g.1512  ORF Transcript_861/g.1512 Transcript_861/m.1512 type:complete len:92 (-) Transcript_861:285-560(-)
MSSFSLQSSNSFDSEKVLEIAGRLAASFGVKYAQTVSRKSVEKVIPGFENTYKVATATLKLAMVLRATVQVSTLSHFSKSCTTSQSLDAVI